MICLDDSSAGVTWPWRQSDKLGSSTPMRDRRVRDTGLWQYKDRLTYVWEERGNQGTARTPVWFTCWWSLWLWLQQDVRKICCVQVIRETDTTSAFLNSHHAWTPATLIQPNSQDAYSYKAFCYARQHTGGSLQSILGGGGRSRAMCSDCLLYTSPSPRD